MATAQRVFLADELERRPAEDPEVVFVLYMAFCAVDVLGGQLPGPYSDEDARAYARRADPPRGARAPRARRDARLAHGLGVPVDELHTARQDHARNPAGIGDSA